MLNIPRCDEGLYTPKPGDEFRIRFAYFMVNEKTVA